MSDDEFEYLLPVEVMVGLEVTNSTVDPATCGNITLEYEEVTQELIV